MPESTHSSPLTPIANLPRHIAIIMDGNNRWAKQRRLPGIAGHKAGVESVRTVVECCARYGIEVLTLFAFSSENWQRPANEVSALMELFMVALNREVKKLHKNNIRLHIIGNRSRFSSDLQRKMADAEQLTAGNTGLTLVIAANYGGQWDIAQAARRLSEQVAAGAMTPEQITPEQIQRHICLADYPMPDLCIRTGGEQRISNFLLWQFAYTELYFCDHYWPDFREEAFVAALKDYSGRQRRFGKTSEQVEGQD